jgi:hypothetical protein
MKHPLIWLCRGQTYSAIYILWWLWVFQTIFVLIAHAQNSLWDCLNEHHPNKKYVCGFRYEDSSRENILGKSSILRFLTLQKKICKGILYNTTNHTTIIGVNYFIKGFTFSDTWEEKSIILCLIGKQSKQLFWCNGEDPGNCGSKTRVYWVVSNKEGQQFIVPKIRQEITILLPNSLHRDTHTSIQI